MDTQNLPYDVCRRYVSDYKAKLRAGEADRILGWIRSRSINKLASCSSSFPDALSDRERYRTFLQVEAFFKKVSSYRADSARCEATASFLRAETLCRITNRRLDYFSRRPDRLDRVRARQIEKMQDQIFGLLGRMRPFLDSLPRLIRVTSGATSTRARKQATPHLKIGMKPVCTPGAARYLKLLAEYFGYGPLRPRLVRSNRVEFVPKNWKTDRTIACEPEGNVPLQLAFDSYAKKRLLRWKVDLSSQSKNQRMAREASITGEFSTIDLSMASDTLSVNVVALLFPEEWQDYLFAVRSPFYMMQEGEAEYAKFSSMGNGSTFVLETMVFAAACKAVGSKAFSVYGDDIIIETELVDELKALLRFLGFVVNLEKSHTTGPFRESCGMNAFLGVDITPFYIRELDRRKAFKCHLVNGIASVSKPGGAVWELLLSIVKKDNLPLVPFNDDTMSGVFVDIQTAYAKKVLRKRSGKKKSLTVSYKAYKPYTRRIRISGYQPLFLWYLSTFGRQKGGCVETSWVPSSSHKYVRKWVHWFHPVAGIPGHLYWWSELL